MSDLIKREDAIKVVRHIAFENVDADTRQKLIEAIPSAENKGEWIEIWEDGMSTKAKCNNCKRESDRPLGNFCKWCGARMVK